MKKITLYIKGMHCPSCEVLVKDKLKQLKNVVSVKADFRSRQAEVSSSEKLRDDEINLIDQQLRPFGYQIVDQKRIKDDRQSLIKRISEPAAIAVCLFILYYFAAEFNLIPKIQVGSGLTLPLVFILGIVASTSTCMATTGTLFLTIIGKLNKSDSNAPVSNLSPAILFNFGRILSYAFFGYIFGLFGSIVSVNLQLSSILTAVVSIAMVLIGLDMLQIVSFSSLSLSSWTTRIFEKIESFLLKNPKKTSFFIGASTYLLPCGFTQTVQLYAIGLANPVKSATMMAVFALGTTPLLMTVGLLSSSFSRSKFYLLFQKVIAVLIVVIGFSYFGNFLSLNGVDVSLTGAKQSKMADSNVKLKNGVQVARMTVDSSGYSPNYFAVKQAIPVRWLIEGKNVYGCQGYFVVPSLGIQQQLKPGQNMIEFTPKEPGLINFSCSMGMYRGQIEVI